MKRKLGTSYFVDITRGFITAISILLFTISISNHWADVLSVIFAIVYLICLFWSITKPLFSKERLKLFDWIEVAYHFVTIIVIAFVDVINYKEFFTESVIQVVCVIASGFFTLYGVALSIKFNIWNEQDKERGKAKPHVFPVSNDTWEKLDESLIKTTMITEKYTSLKKADKRRNHYMISELHLFNSDASTCFLKGLFINGEKFLIFKYDEALNKNSYNRIVVNFAFEIEEIRNVFLVFGDVLDNTYLSKSSYEIIKNKQKKCYPVEIRGFTKTTLRNDIDCDDLIIKYYEKN